jgi:hypothetical protein
MLIKKPTNASIVIQYNSIFFHSYVHRSSTTTGHISQKGLNKLPEDGILNAETCKSEKRWNYVE